MTGVRLAIHRTFHSLQVRNYRLYFIGQAVSVTGTWIQTMASAWLVLKLTDSAVALAAVTALTFLPMLLLGPWGGVIADRFDKRRTLVATQTSFAILAAVLGTLTVTGVVKVWEIMVLALLQGIVTAADNPTRQSFVIEMVGERDVTNAVSLNSALMTGTRVVGPAIAAVLIYFIGIGWCFIVNAISYLAVIWCLVEMRVSELNLRARRDDSGGVRAGLRYVRNESKLQRPLALMAVVFTLSFNFSVLFPLLAKYTFGGTSWALGLLLSSMGVGSVLGALVLAHRSRPIRWMLPLSAMAFGATTLIAAWAPSLEVEALTLVLVGFTSILFMITGNSTMQLTSSDEMRGRVMALYGMVFLGTTPIGSMFAGILAKLYGARWSLAMGAIVAVLAGLMALLIDRRNGRVSARRAIEEPDLVLEPARVA